MRIHGKIWSRDLGQFELDASLHCISFILWTRGKEENLWTLQPVEMFWATDKQWYAGTVHLVLPNGDVQLELTGAQYRGITLWAYPADLRSRENGHSVNNERLGDTGSV